MKKSLLFLLVIISATANGQTLKELLYSGKLKNDPGTVVRKTDDLQSKMVDTTKKADSTLITGNVDSNAVQLPDSIMGNNKSSDVVIKDSIVQDIPTTKPTQNAVSNETPNTEPKEEVPPAVSKVPVKSNTKIWKDYTTVLTAELKAQVLSSRKVKKDTYSIIVEHEIDTVGRVNVLKVTVAPENELLQESVMQRIVADPPTLNPVLNSTGIPQKSKRRYSFYITKD